eukprot:6395467-Pyramimonas_sp.AAC.1
MVFWHDSGSSRRSSQALQTVVFQRGSSPNGNEPLSGPLKKGLGGRIYFKIFDDSWVYTGPPPPPPRPQRRRPCPG